MKKIIFAYVLGVACSIGFTAYGAKLMGSSGEIIIPAVATPAATPEPLALRIEAVVLPKVTVKPIPMPTISAEEARLRSIESRLKVLESKIK